jgi:hypothetical protein
MNLYIKMQAELEKPKEQIDFENLFVMCQQILQPELQKSFIQKGRAIYFDTITASAIALTCHKAGLEKMALEWADKIQSIVSNSDVINAGVFATVFPMKIACKIHYSQENWNQLDKDLE